VHILPLNVFAAPILLHISILILRPDIFITRTLIRHKAMTETRGAETQRLLREVARDPGVCVSDTMVLVILISYLVFMV
jgi:hypothetical protein